MPAKHTETIKRELNCDSQHRAVRAITLTYLHQCLRLTMIGGGFHESIVATMIAHSLSTRDFGHHFARSGFPNDVEWHGSIGEIDAGRPS